MIVAIVVSLLALALAAAAWFRPTHDATPATPQYSEQQVADAKKNVCGAYDTVLRAIKSAGALNSEDPNQKFMLAFNTRLAFNAAADYLLASASQNPAAPASLLLRDARTCDCIPENRPSPNRPASQGRLLKQSTTKWTPQ